MPSIEELVLVLAKTYPTPSAKYVETSCVAGITEHGEMRRLYPIPFRSIGQEQQFKKWQWIKVRTEKKRDDHRPESHRVYSKSIQCCNEVSVKNYWQERWYWIDKIPTFSDFSEIEKQRGVSNATLALLRPRRIVGLDIKPSRQPDWTPEEKEKLVRDFAQKSLFDEGEVQHQIRELEKIPFDFHYRYICDTPGGEVEYRHKITDWEAGALFRNCKRSHGEDWEQPFRAKLEIDLVKNDLMFLMGTQHRFPDQWLIISLFYPPKRNAIQSSFL